MERVAKKVCLLTVSAVIFGVIWQGVALAAAPVVESLGRIKDDLIVSSRVDVDGDGSVYVVDPRRSAVYKYDAYAKRVATFDKVSPDGRGLAVTPDGSALYVSSNSKVEVVDTATGNVTPLGGAAFTFSRVADIDVDDKGFVYVADAGDYAVKVFAPNGVMAYRFGSKGDNPGQFQGLNGLSVDSANGLVYVADSVYTNASTPEVMVFTLSGSLVTSFPGATGFGTAKLTFFNGITFDNLGRLYVFDGFKGYMYAYELAGNTLANQFTYSKVGYAEGELSSPQDAVFDPATGRLFVACSNGRVEILGIDGASNPVEVNVAPSVPAPVSPVGDSVVTSAVPALRFANAVDADAMDVVSYDVAVYAGADLTTPAAEISGVAQGDTFTEVPVSSTGLIENGRHAWKVRAFDGTDYSAWSELQTFWLDAVAEAPSSPVAVAPLAADTVLDGSGTISWESASDADPFATVGYELEIALDENFETLRAVELVDAVSAGLGTLQDYDRLVPGSGYFWRVTAVDDDGMRSEASATGAFLYDTTVLQISSPMPGTLIYLGGDQAYPGRLIGEAPQELRDFPAGATTVVAERAGFEPFVAPVDMPSFGKVVVVADLVKALAPEDFKSQPVDAAGAKIDLTSAAAPVLADVDHDGLLDLLVLDAAGAATLYPGSEEGFLAGEALSLADPVADASPFVIDWNNDGKQDLLVGGASSLVLYAGMEGAPVVLQDALNALAGESQLVPVVGQLTDDDAKDLLVGTASGQVFLLANGGTDEAPTFSGKEPVLKSAFKGPVAPALVDWDADGVRDLLVATQGAVYLCVAGTDGFYAPVQMISVGNLATRNAGGKGKAATADSALLLGSQLRFVATDLDGKSGKDLLVGNADGELLALVAHGDQLATTCRDAILEKVGLVADAGVDVSGIVASLDAGKTEQAVARAETLLADPELSDAAAQLLAELIEVLN